MYYLSVLFLALFVRRTYDDGAELKTARRGQLRQMTYPADGVASPPAGRRDKRHPRGNARDSAAINTNLFLPRHRRRRRLGSRPFPDFLFFFFCLFPRRPNPKIIALRNKHTHTHVTFVPAQCS